jgi:RNA polymerase sigma factor (sigma-70 family)
MLYCFLALAAARHYTAAMADVTEILEAIQQGQPQAADALLPLVYDELRKLAAAKLVHEQPGHTLQATALVHEAYLRLVGPACRAGPDVMNDANAGSRPADGTYDSRGHFFAAAAEAMRRILVEAARRKQRLKRGGELARRELVEQTISLPVPDGELLAVDEALGKLESTNRQAAELVKLRYFAGFTIPEAAEQMGISARKANQIWTYARAWLAVEIDKDSSR